MMSEVIFEENLILPDKDSDEYELENLLICNIDINVETLINNSRNIIDMFKDECVFEKKSLISKTIDGPIVDYKMCPNCDVLCKIHDTQIICTNCGMEREWNIHENNVYSSTLDENYNTSSNSFMSFNIVGAKSYCYNRSLQKTCSDATTYRANNNKKDIINKIYQYEGTNHPPANVINATADLFDQIKQKGYVYRGDLKLGVIGACLYYTSIMHNLTRTPKEIAQIMGIEDKFLSSGDRTLQELNELNIISIPTNYKPLDDYLKMYMPALGIDLKYKPFIVHIIARAERKHLHIGNESRMTSKVVGVIYLLTKRLPQYKHIKKEMICAACNGISRSTFIRYYSLIIANFKVLKKSFRKFHIPMDNLWRD